MALAFDLYEAAEQMMRQNLRRRSPNASDERIEQGIREWLARRPGAEHGDGVGRPGTRFEDQSVQRLRAGLIRLRSDLLASQAAWALIGGLAVSARAEPRTTRDLDVAVSVSGDSAAEAIVRFFFNHGYQLEDQLEQEDTGRLATMRFRVPGEEAGGVVADLLFASSGIEPELVAAAETLEVMPGLFLPVARTGHLLALKVLALDLEHPERRPAGSGGHP